MPDKQKKRERDGKEECKLRVRGGHAVALAVHCYNSPLAHQCLSITASCV